MRTRAEPRRVAAISPTASPCTAIISIPGTTVWAAATLAMTRTGLRVAMRSADIVAMPTVTFRLAA